MANINKNIAREIKEEHEIECGMYLRSCLTDGQHAELSRGWHDAGGTQNCPWWKWCLDNINVSIKE